MKIAACNSGAQYC